MPNGVRLAVADDHIGLTAQDGRNKAGDLVAGVLVVAIGIDDYIRAQPETGVESGLEDGGQPPVGRVAHDVRHAEVLRHRHRIVGTAVVDDEGVDAVDAGDAGRQGGNCLWKRGRFVVTGNLDNEVHG